jgi:hypothetical protein
MGRTLGKVLMVGLVMFQLAIGLQWRLMQAVVAPGQMAAGHCAAHAHPDLGKDTRHGGEAASASSAPQMPGTQHDCCRSLGCQCHCVPSPVMAALTLAGPAFSVSFRVPVFDARPPVARTNELFRPPIA